MVITEVLFVFSFFKKLYLGILSINFQEPGELTLPVLETLIIPEGALVWSSCLTLNSRLQSPTWLHGLALHLCPPHLLCIPASPGCSMVRPFPSLHLTRSFFSECAVFLLRVNTDSSYCHPHLGTSVWHSSDVLWSPPRKLSSETQPLALFISQGP